MNNYILIILIGIYCIYSIYHYYFKRKGCKGNCNLCQVTNCHIDYKEIFGEIRQKELNK